MSYMAGCGKCLRLVSVGQYKTNLYYKNNCTYSSVTGGIITILCSSVLSYIALAIFISTVNRDNYNLETTAINLHSE
jgi:hypothetical protein